MARRRFSGAPQPAEHNGHIEASAPDMVQLIAASLDPCCRLSGSVLERVPLRRTWYDATRCRNVSSPTRHVSFTEAHVARVPAQAHRRAGHVMATAFATAYSGFRGWSSCSTHVLAGGRISHSRRARPPTKAAARVQWGGQRSPVILGASGTPAETYTRALAKPWPPAHSASTWTATTAPKFSSLMRSELALPGAQPTTAPLALTL